MHNRSLLILRCDVERLRADGLALESETELIAQLSSLGLGARVSVVSHSTRADLLQKLGALHRPFDVVVVIAHSNETGTQLASDRWASWPEVARYLDPFKPKRLLLIACRAGGWPAVAPLFSEIRSLRHLFASPANMNVASAQLLLCLLPHVVDQKTPSRDAVETFRTLAPLLTGSPLRHWRLARNGKIHAGESNWMDLFARFVR